MQKSWFYIKDSSDFIRKTKNLTNIIEDAILVSADGVGLYPSTSHRSWFEALEKALDERE